MKRLFVLILLCSLICSCKKDNSSPTTLQKMVGTWELRYREGGIIAHADTFLPGNGRTVTFYSNMRYKEINLFSDSTISEGYIKYYLDSTAWCGLYERIEYFNDSDINLMGDMVSISGNKLTLISAHIYDGITQEFEKIGK
jgi:hypothetical protein